MQPLHESVHGTNEEVLGKLTLVASVPIAGLLSRIGLLWSDG